jgi:hypothetical protein
MKIAHVVSGQFPWGNIDGVYDTETGILTPIPVCKNPMNDEIARPYSPVGEKINVDFVGHTDDDHV